MKAGKHKIFRLKHGTNVRTFTNVEIRHPTFNRHDKDGNVIETVTLGDRWELVGTEQKIEATQKGRTKTVEVPVVVGIAPENVLD